MENTKLLNKLGLNSVTPKVEIEEVEVRAAYYIRVSTDDQADPTKGSLDEQKKRCLQAIDNHHWKFVDLVFKDVQKGHRIESREGLMAMMDAANKGEFDVLVVYDADRFSRDRDTALLVRQTLKKNFIQFYSYNQPREIVDPRLYDPQQDDSEVIHEAIVDIKADIDVKGIRRKVRQGARKRALRGDPHNVPYGLNKDYKRIHPTVEFDILVNEAQSEVVKRIFKHFVREDYSYRKICTVLNKEKIPAPMGGLWRPPSVRKILANPFYIGIVRHNHRPVFRGKRKQTSPEEWILVPNEKIPKLIDEDTFKVAQERMRQRYIFRGRAIASEGLLIPLAYCHCGHRLHYKRQNPTPSTLKRSPNAKPRIHYGCPCNHISGVKVCPCNTYKMSAAKLEGVIIQRIHELAQNAEVKEAFERLSIDKFIESLKHQVAAKKKEIFKLNFAKDRWDSAFQEGFVTPQTYYERSKEVEMALKTAKEELTKLERSLASIEENNALLDKKRKFLMKFDEHFNNGDLAKKKKVLQQFIKRVVVGDKGEVHIEFIVDDVLDGVLVENNVHPHPCGYYKDPKRPCKCLPGQISRYAKRISGPLLDRIDIHVWVPSVDTYKLIGKQTNENENSKSIQRRIQKARDAQLKRFKGLKIVSNGEMSSNTVKEFCLLNADCRTILRSAISSMNLSARSYFKVIKISRTIADLEETKEVSTNHIAEALQYRPKEDV
ncbi:recombinase family protein [Candidatus Woesebacteria bacterium]|nr:MAG: recombinase family protein [Candidatus Woesebacteria bacterium]